MNKAVISKKTVLLILIILIAGYFIYHIYDSLRENIDSRNLLGVFHFYANIEEIERIVVYDKNDSVLEKYEGNQLESLKNKYINTEANFKIPWPKYKREVKRHLKDLEFTVEVVFPENRNEDKDNRKFIKNIHTEILSIYKTDIKDVEEEPLYNQYIIHIDGQDYVMFLRDILLQICNTN